MKCSKTAPKCPCYAAKDVKKSFDRTFDKAWNVLKAKMCEECGFPIDPTNAVYPPGSECICDLKGGGN